MTLRSILTLLLLVVFATTAFAQERKTAHRTLVIKDGKVITDNISGDDDIIRFSEGELFGKRAYLGVSLIDLTPELREHYGAAKDAGVLVGSVEENGPADKAGVKVGDIIISVDGKDVSSSSELRRALKDKKDGDSVRIETLRGRGRQTVVASVVEREGTPFFLRSAGDGLEILRTPAEFRATRMTALPNCLELQTKLRELETKMKDLEKKLQK